MLLLGLVAFFLIAFFFFRPLFFFLLDLLFLLAGHGFRGFFIVVSVVSVGFLAVTAHVCSHLLHVAEIMLEILISQNLVDDDEEKQNRESDQSVNDLHREIQTLFVGIYLIVQLDISFVLGDLRSRSLGNGLGRRLGRCFRRGLGLTLRLRSQALIHRYMKCVGKSAAILGGDSDQYGSGSVVQGGSLNGSHGSVGIRCCGVQDQFCGSRCYLYVVLPGAVHKIRRNGSVLHIQCGQRVIRGRQRRDTHHKEKDQAKDQRALPVFLCFVHKSCTSLTFKPRRWLFQYHDDNTCCQNQSI